MQIEIVNVTENQKQSSNGRGYTELEVIYKNQEGKAQTKKIMSFSNPAVFKAVKDATAGSKLEITTEKDGNGYWQWTGIGSNNATNVAKPATTVRTGGSNYETPEERALRQKYIVRQSSLTTALGILSVGAKSLDKQAVFELAAEIEQWVFRKATVVGSFDDMEDDIPL